MKLDRGIRLASAAVGRILAHSAPCNKLLEFDVHQDGNVTLRAAGFRLLALVPDQSAAALDRVARLAAAGRVALLLGSEGDGLSSRWLREADESVCIPMSPQAMALGVDSLNVVAAAAVACYALLRGAS
jgi:tRNA G18 (ribose-2'-O)-methylase SpoU